MTAIVCLVLFFVFGLLCSFALKANAVANSKKNGFPVGTKGVKAYLRHYAVILGVRLICQVAMFVIILGGTAYYSPDFVPALLSIPLFLSSPISLFVGLGSDNLLEKFQDKVSWLKGMIPPAPPAEAVEEEADAASAGH
jgi:hypothetical protein